jgi:hypothetical protein
MKMGGAVCRFCCSQDGRHFQLVLVQKEEPYDGCYLIDYFGMSVQCLGSLARASFIKSELCWFYHYEQQGPLTF